MKLSVNSSTAFGGEREVLYALKQSASKAKLIESYRRYSIGPKPMQTSLEMREARGALNAYADMAVNDITFVKAINNINPKSDFMQKISEILKPINIGYCVLYPFSNFTESLRNAAVKHNLHIEQSLNSFFAKIKM